MRSAGARVLVLPISGVCSLATTAVAIDYGGIDSYAAISVVLAIALLLPFADLGLGAGVINAYSDGRGPDDRRDLLASTVRLLVLSASLLVVAAILVSVFVSWSRLFGFSEEPPTPSGIEGAIVLAVVIFAISVPLGVGQRILIGIGKNHYVVFAGAITSVVTLLVVVVVSVAGLPSAFMAVAAAVGVLVSSLVMLRLAWSSIDLRFADLIDRRRRARGVLSLGAYMLCVSCFLAILFQSGRLIISHLCDDYQLASYSIAMQLYLPAVSILGSAGFALWPMFAGRRGRASTGGVSQVSFTKLVGIMVALGSAGCIALVFVLPLVSRVVSGHSVDPPLSLGLGVGALLVAQSAQVVPGMYLTDLAGMRFQAVCAILAATSAVLLGVYVAGPFGATGVVFATAAAVFLFQAAPSTVRMWLRERSLRYGPSSGALNVDLSLTSKGGK
ncbi:lipopolysaccharide biosynthesis protein [Gordonia sp. 135]|uniref:lipopolysaccharide biosynthesis protein n=1 Tax=Gordonia sp. 135 TaxID=2676309 RepID=UPI003FA5EA0B